MKQAEKISDGVIALHPSYHGWPTVICNHGELLAVCSGNRQSHVCPFGRIFLYRSDDGGKTWSGPEFLSHGPLDDRDAGICRAADGSILINYFTSILALADNPEHIPKWDVLAREITLETLKREHGFWMRRSTDGGRTWSEKYEVPVNSPHGASLLDDGSLFSRDVLKFPRRQMRIRALASVVRWVWHDRTTTE